MSLSNERRLRRRIDDLKRQLRAKDKEMEELRVGKQVLGALADEDPLYTSARQIAYQEEQLMAALAQRNAAAAHTPISLNPMRYTTPGVK